MPMITVRALRVARRAEDAGKLAELRSATQAWVALFRLHFPAAIPTAPGWGGEIDPVRLDGAEPRQTP